MKEKFLNLCNHGVTEPSKSSRASRTKKQFPEYTDNITAPKKEKSEKLRISKIAKRVERERDEEIFKDLAEKEEKTKPKVKLKCYYVEANI